MRAVRFATRFNFAPDPAILTAAASEEVSYYANSDVH
jgi:tRNA nucleotidyltransferase/poly(A) polymerase